MVVGKKEKQKKKGKEKRRNYSRKDDAYQMHHSLTPFTHVHPGLDNLEHSYVGRSSLAWNSASYHGSLVIVARTRYAWAGLKEVMNEETTTNQPKCK